MIFLFKDINVFIQVQQNDRYGCHCQMKDLISQDYIDYQYEGGERKQHPYSGMPVDDLDRACHNHRLVNTEKTVFSSKLVRTDGQPKRALLWPIDYGLAIE